MQIKRSRVFLFVTIISLLLGFVQKEIL